MQETAGRSNPTPHLPKPRGEAGTFDAPPSRLITPFSIVPMRLAQSVGGRIAWGFGLFVLCPLVIWGYWIVHVATHPLPPDYLLLRIALPLGALMGVLNPFLFSSAERAIVAWISQLDVDKSFGWNASLARRRERLINRLYYPLCASGVIAAVVIFTFAEPLVRPYTPIPVPHVWGLAIKYAIVSLAGFSAISDLHLVARWAVVVRAAVSRTNLNWSPFPTSGYASLAGAYRVSLLAAFSFSLGALWVPLLFVIKSDLPPAGSALVWMFLLLLAAGGLVAFTVPFVAIILGLLRSKRRFRDCVDAPIGKALDVLTKQPPEKEFPAELSDRIVKMLEIRRVVASVRVVPIVHTVGRTLLTVAVPIASFSISFWRTWSSHG